MKMENYYFCSIDHERVVIPEEVTEYSLGGEGYGREGFIDGSKIQTSMIINVKDGVAQTASGSKYELGKMHPDYAELIAAIEAGTPVIKSWSLKGNLRDGYVLTGKVGENTVSGKVNSQDGNYIVLDGTRYLVIWKNLNLEPFDRLDIMFTGKYCDLNIRRDFSEYMHDHTRPNLMA